MSCPREFKPHAYQSRAIDFVLDNRYAALFLDMGLGKTVITLSALSLLIDCGEVTRCLIVAPKKVAEATWSAEAKKWRHLCHLRISTILGNAMQRAEAAEREADVYVTSRDLFADLVANHPGKRWKWDAVVIDELTSFKSPSSQRFRAFKKVRPSLYRVIGLTGTPAPNGLLDLWAQIYCLDGGERLGRYVTHYRRQYFDERRVNNIPIKCELRPGAAEAIRAKIADISLTMQAADYLTLPPLLPHDVHVPLPPDVMKQYRAFEREKVMGWNPNNPDGAIVASSAAALANKLQQFANGGVYTEERRVQEIHTAKAERLAEIVEAAASPVLVFYQFQHDIPRCLDRLKDYRVREYNGPDDLNAWNRGELNVLFAHPAATAYGLNMQEGGHHVVWLGTGWNLEHYQQANARLHRQGQQHPVIVHRLICPDTIDERAAAAVESKSAGQQNLLNHLKKLRATYEQEEA